MDQGEAPSPAAKVARVIANFGGPGNNGDQGVMATPYRPSQPATSSSEEAETLDGNAAMGRKSAGTLDVISAIRTEASEHGLLETLDMAGSNHPEKSRSDLLEERKLMNLFLVRALAAEDSLRQQLDSVYNAGVRADRKMIASCVESSLGPFKVSLANPINSIKLASLMELMEGGQRES